MAGYMTSILLQYIYIYIIAETHKWFLHYCNTWLRPKNRTICVYTAKSTIVC